MRLLTVAAALAGAADTCQFFISRRERMRQKPGRAAGSLAMALTWMGLAASAALEPRPSSRSLGLAAAALLANAGLLAAHVGADLSRRPRVWVGPTLAVVSLGSLGAGRALRGHRPGPGGSEHEG